jgi:hypothetical protein
MKLFFEMTRYVILNSANRLRRHKVLRPAPRKALVWLSSVITKTEGRVHTKAYFSCQLRYSLEV